jgi:methylated-DNA-protein-cysteine methyltransferase related protein
MMGVAKKTRNQNFIEPSRLPRTDQSETRRRSCQTSPADDPDALSPAERIWQVVAAIPRGYVASYGQVARLAGMPRHARLVGRTLSQLPAGTRLPWHRVLNAALKIASRGDDRAESRQRRRLEREGVSFVGARAAREHLWQR